MRVYRDVQLLTSAEYSRVLDRFVGYVSRLPGVRAVFRFGGLSHPGISDLDVLVVVADHADAWTLQGIQGATQGGALASYLFAHPPVVVPEGEVPRVRWVHTLYGLEQLWGDPLEIPPPPPEVGPWLAIAEYVDFTFSVRSVLRSLEGENVGLRSLLLLLTSCLHSLRLAADLLGQPVHAEIEETVRRLRDQACEGIADFQGVKEATGAVVRRLREADRALVEFLVRTGVVTAEPVRECVPWADGRYYLFEHPLRDTNFTTSTSLAGRWWWRHVGVDPRVDVYPACYLAQFSAYARSHGPLGRAHQLLFGTRFARLIQNPAYAEVLEERIAGAERTYGVIRRGGLRPMVPLGIGFRLPEEIRPSRRRRWLRGLVLRELSRGGA
ncbi:MAG: hypothetical protein QN172_02730 [Armatimonadota bacterium]|nr:hypothetical protein [Armatimonadota bacterium]MDR7438945.1 hypothetical protein [Armatimonadota bacterium]MDR7562843.1 hypothetical protein [Armatimonadota bacterium]MDR7601356.1 hypothetical protein [Armatimonadota bacterium]